MLPVQNPRPYGQELPKDQQTKHGNHNPHKHHYNPRYLPATLPTITPTKPGPKLTIAQLICALENQMTKEERGAYLDARDMGEDFCSAEL
jgi:hypothetical protein